jgi:diguanylate cyclase (GGDEF)-like protein
MLDPFRLAPEDRPHEANLLDALADHLYRRAIATALLFLPTLYLLYRALEDACRRRPALGWAFGALLLLMLPRVVLVANIGRIKARFPDPRMRVQIYAVSVSLVGLGLATINVLAAPVVNAEQMGLMIFIVAAANSVAILSIGPSVGSFLLYMVPTMGSLILLLRLGPAMANSQILLLLVIVHILVLGTMVVSVHLSLRKSILLGLRVREANQALYRTNSELRRLTNVDGLTGLSNRRSFDEYLGAQWKLAIREQTPCSMLMIDVDDFKRYNDTYGHLAGDEVLKSIAATLHKRFLRPADLVARFGGEEFVVVLPKTPFAALQLLGESLRRDVEDMNIPYRASAVGEYVTVSVGGASTIPQREDSFVLLIEAADAALYEAKRTGKNRMVTHGQDRRDLSGSTT